jgi:uncharacterized membrane protein YbhN (UPF0104 family)
MAETSKDPEASLPKGAIAPWRKRAKAILPWAIAVAAIAYVFSRVPISEAWAEAQSADLFGFTCVVFGAIVVWFAIESSLYSFLFTRFNADVSFREARSLRGMSYLLTPIHWNVGKAAVILRLRQTKQVPVLEATSTVMLYQAVDGMILAGFAALGMTLLPFAEGSPDNLSQARFWALSLIGLTLFNFALLRARWPNFRWLAWWRGISLHLAHRKVMPLDFTLLLLGKTAYHFIYILVFYFGTQAFGIDLPFALALAATPIIQAVGGLPLSPMGLGTQQAAMLYFFGSRFGGNAEEATIVAFGFSFPVALNLGRCLIGLFYLQDLTASRALIAEDPGPAPAEPANVS